MLSLIRPIVGCRMLIVQNWRRWSAALVVTYLAFSGAFVFLHEGARRGNSLLGSSAQIKSAQTEAEGNAATDEPQDEESEEQLTEEVTPQDEETFAERSTDENADGAKSDEETNPAEVPADENPEEQMTDEEKPAEEESAADKSDEDHTIETKSDESPDEQMSEEEKTVEEIPAGDKSNEDNVAESKSDETPEEQMTEDEKPAEEKSVNDEAADEKAEAANADMEKIEASRATVERSVELATKEKAAAGKFAAEAQEAAKAATETAAEIQKTTQRVTQVIAAEQKAAAERNAIEKAAADKAATERTLLEKTLKEQIEKVNEKLKQLAERPADLEKTLIPGFGEFKAIRDEMRTVRQDFESRIDRLERMQTQKYSSWKRSIGCEYYVCTYRCTPVGSDIERYHCAYYYPSDPKYIYFFNATHCVFWGRFIIGAEPANEWEWLPLNQRVATCAGTAPRGQFAWRGAMPVVDESLDFRQRMLWPSLFGLPGIASELAMRRPAVPTPAIESLKPNPPAPEKAALPQY